MEDKLAKAATPGGLTVPDFLKGYNEAKGFEEMGRDDVVLPRLIVCQALTPQRKKTHPNYIANLQDGDLFNSVSGDIYGGSVELIPVTFKKSRIYFRDLKDGGGILCQSSNSIDGGTICPTCAECPNSQFGADGSTPVCSLFFNYPALVLPSLTPIVVSLKATGLKVGKQWNARMKMLGKKPMYAAVYEFKTQEVNGNKGSYFVPVVTLKRFVNEPEFNTAMLFSQQIAGKVITTDQLDREEETGYGDEPGSM